MIDPETHTVGFARVIVHVDCGEAIPAALMQKTNVKENSIKLRPIGIDGLEDALITVK